MYKRQLYDFDPSTDLVPYERMEELDKWAVLAMNRMLQKATDAYESYAYHLVYHSVYNFCVVDMSNFYLDVIKDLSLIHICILAAVREALRERAQPPAMQLQKRQGTGGGTQAQSQAPAAGARCV